MKLENVKLSPPILSHSFALPYIDCRLVLALIQTPYVNLKKVAAALYGQAKVDRHYRRLQQFFAQHISPEIFASLILERIAKEGQPLYLSLDQTHWKLGKTHQNILCLGLLFQGVSIPFMYKVSYLRVNLSP